MSKFSNNLKNLRMERGISQKEMAEILDMTVNAYQKYEYGTREPNYETLCVIAEYFKVPTDYLLGQGFFKNWEQIIENKETVINAANQVISQYLKLPNVIDLNEVPEGSLMLFLSAFIDHVEFENGGIQIYLSLPDNDAPYLVKPRLE